MRAYEGNEPKFQALLPRWSKLVGDAEEKDFRERPVAPFEGKVILLEREYTPKSPGAYQVKSPEVYPVKLANDLNKIYIDDGFIATSPEEVGTLVYVHTLRDQAQMYERGAVYSSVKFHVFVVDPATGEIRGSTELKVDKFDPPSSMRDGIVILRPNDKLYKLIESLAPRKG